MTHSIDTSFKLKKQARLTERRRKLWRWVLSGVAAFAVVSIATGFYLTKDYWSFGDERNVAWYYPDPIPEQPRLKDLIAFFNERVDIEVDGEPEERPHTQWSVK